MIERMTTDVVMLSGHGGDPIEAYVALPQGDQRRGGVLVIHHMPGWDRATREITRRFAELGYAAICPNLHYREAPGADPDDAAAASRAAGGVPDERFVGDARAAVAWLRALPASNGRVGSIGYCSGGRQSFLAASTVPLDAAVDCYGGFVIGDSPPGFPVPMSGLEHTVPDVACPILGLFGADDRSPSPEAVTRLEQLLIEAGRQFEFHSYEGAGHGFFSVDRPAYRVAAANDGWERIASFFARHLS